LQISAPKLKSVDQYFIVGGTAIKLVDGQVWKNKKKGRALGDELDGILKKKVVMKRCKRYGWGINKIAGMLRLKGYDVDHNMVIALSVKQV
jgi:hypothetical protein